MQAVRAPLASSLTRVDCIVNAVRNFGIMPVNVRNGTSNRYCQQRAYIILRHTSSDLVAHLLDL
eukprot:4035961-Pyramimonas_sp.AAC.1